MFLRTNELKGNNFLKPSWIASLNSDQAWSMALPCKHSTKDSLNRLKEFMKFLKTPSASKDSTAVTVDGNLFQLMTVLVKKEFCRPHWWFAFGRICGLHKSYCRHCVGFSCFSHPQAYDRSYISCRVCCPGTFSLGCPIPDLLDILRYTARCPSGVVIRGESGCSLF